jgi:hypothetical protein
MIAGEQCPNEAVSGIHCATHQRKNKPRQIPRIGRSAAKKAAKKNK